MNLKKKYLILDITDDLVPIDEASLQRKRAKISRYQSMSIEERREYNQKRRLKQLGLPENIDEVAPEKLNQIKKHISEVNARKAEAARQRYHRMVNLLNRTKLSVILRIQPSAKPTIEGGLNRNML